MMREIRDKALIELAVHGANYSLFTLLISQFTIFDSACGLGPFFLALYNFSKASSQGQIPSPAVRPTRRGVIHAAGEVEGDWPDPIRNLNENGGSPLPSDRQANWH
jgi:hypothetical protein